HQGQPLALALSRAVAVRGGVAVAGRRAAPAAGGPGRGVRRQRFRQQRAAGIPGQPGLLPQHGGVARPGSRPDLDTAQGTRGPTHVPLAPAAAERPLRRAAADPGRLRRHGHRRVVEAPRMKPPDFWKTYVTLAVAAGLGAYIYFVESKKEEKPDKPKEKVLTLDKAKVKELTLAGAGKEEVKLVKDGTAWRMTAPQAAPADSQESESVLSSLEGLEIDQVVTEAPGKLSDFGL